MPAPNNALLVARAALSRFTPERPMVVSKSVHQAMLAEAGLKDMLDRVVVSQPLPLRDDQ